MNRMNASRYCQTVTGTPSISPFALTRQGGGRALPHAMPKPDRYATARSEVNPSPWSEARRGGARQGGGVFRCSRPARSAVEVPIHDSRFTIHENGSTSSHPVHGTQRVIGSPDVPAPPIPRRHGILTHALTVLALLLPLLAGASAIEPLPFESEAERQRFKALVEELRCTVCQNQSLADSDADLAGDLRREVFTQMRAGRSDTEIREFMVARYGEFILYNPPLAAHTLILWAGPGVLLGIAIIVALVTVHKRRQRLDVE